MQKDKLWDELYYHGLLPREDIKLMLRLNGDFLVRMTEPQPNNPRAYVLSVMVDQEKEDQGIKHYVITQAGAKYTIEKYAFDSIPEMVTHHLTRADSISKQNDRVILRNPILRLPWELSHDDVMLGKRLGEGAYGEVCKGVLKLKNGAKVNVAVKTAKLEQLTKEQIKEIMREARLMRNFDHPNVVKFYGVAAGQEPLYLVMELVDCGALDSFLQKSEQPIKAKVAMCMGAAWGLEYLHSKNVLHRDIAARNCLFGEQRVKISDFGLTREGTVYQMDPHHRVPIRWLAPETLRTAMYSQKTDVFSYGVLCWEIFSNGIEPYPGMTVAEVNVKVKEGYRMELPPGVPPEMHLIIEKHCWPESPNDRWQMSDIAHNLERVTGLPRPRPGGAQGAGGASPARHLGSNSQTPASNPANLVRSTKPSKKGPRKQRTVLGHH